MSIYQQNLKPSAYKTPLILKINFQFKNISRSISSLPNNIYGIKIWIKEKINGIFNSWIKWHLFILLFSLGIQFDIFPVLIFKKHYWNLATWVTVCWFFLLLPCSFFLLIFLSIGSQPKGNVSKNFVFCSSLPYLFFRLQKSPPLFHHLSNIS